MMCEVLQRHCFRGVEGLGLGFGIYGCLRSETSKLTMGIIASQYLKL